MKTLLLERNALQLDSSEIAFVRAVIQGVSMREATRRYLDETGDPRVIAKKARQFLLAMVDFARHAGRLDDARALALDPFRAVASGVKGVTVRLDTPGQLRAALDPQRVLFDDATLQRLRAWYEPSRAEFRRRIDELRRRQLLALGTDAIVAAPLLHADAAIGAWFHPIVTQRLERGGLRTFRELVAFINLHGAKWIRSVPRIGATTAKQIVEWLELRKDELGLELQATALLTSRERADAWRRADTPLLAVVPIERLAVPSLLSGARGTNRGAGDSQLTATTDLEAIHAWLKSRAEGNAHTERAYRREAERLLLWSVIERRKPLSSLNVDDIGVYRGWLMNPAPVDRWVARSGNNAPRFSPEWRPFVGPLSGRSVDYAIVVVSSLFDWLVRAQYLKVNPFHALARRRGTAAKPLRAQVEALEITDERFFTVAQWRHLQRALKRFDPEVERDQRTRFVFLLAYSSGLRSAELVDAQTGRLRAQLEEVEADESGASTERRRLSLRVLGKGSKVRDVPFVPQVEAAFAQYLTTRGLPDWQDCPSKTRLIARLSPGDGTKPLTGKTVYRICTEVLRIVADGLSMRGLHADAQVFGRASTHWLRHTFGRHALQVGVKLNVVQRVLGHSSLQTTTQYASGPADQAYDEIEQFAGKRL